MIKLIDSPFSPFARKVRMVLEHKGLEFESIDGLLRSNHDLLRSINGRLEAPALIDDGITVINSADIVNYLEDRYPEVPVYPASTAARVHARAWERAADTFIDPVLVNISYWLAGERDDEMPGDFLEVAKRDIGVDPLSWIPDPFRRRIPRCPQHELPIHRPSGNR